VYGLSIIRYINQSCQINNAHSLRSTQRTFMDSRKALDGRAIGLMLVLCAIWGLQQVVLKAMAADIAPLFQIALRSGVAAVLVGVVMLVRRERLSRADGTWRPGLLVAFLFGVEFWLVGEGLRHTSAAHMVVFLYTAPIFAALGLHWRLPAERLSPLQWLGIGLAFSGLGLAFFGRAPVGSAAPGNALWGDFLGLMGGIAWGATTVVVRSSRLARAPATETLLYQLVGAFVLLMAVAWSTGQAHVNFTPQVWASLLFHSLVVAFASFLVWFWLLRQYLAAQLGVFSFLTPMFGIVFGAWWLDERIETRFLMGAVPLMAGIVLVSSQAWLVQKFRRLRPSKVPGAL
jgi:drug/metabolite transporter (DMT)-like permease